MKYLILFLGLLLTACSSDNHYMAPVSNGWHNSQDASPVYRVQANDTIDSIAFRYDLNDQTLAQINHLTPPYHLVVGQKLLLSSRTAPAQNNASDAVITSGAPLNNISSSNASSSDIATTSSLNNDLSVTKNNITNDNNDAAGVDNSVSDQSASSQWQWPAKGKVIHQFSNAYGESKGIDIAGYAGETIHAARNGQVVYCGTGLRGYGLLIIIKHKDGFVSAYAHNSKTLVKENQIVKTGQPIALMGSSDSPQTILHFEIRKAGKPVNPLAYLPTR